MTDVGPYQKVTSGLVSLESSSVDVAEALRRNIAYLLTARVPGAAERAESKDDAAGAAGAGGPEMPAVLGLFPAEAADHRTVAALAVKFYARTGGFLTADVLQRVLQGRGVDPERAARVMFVFDAAARERVDPASFRFWVDDLVDGVRSIRLAEALSSAMQALESRWEDPRTKVTYAGPDAAMELVARAESAPGMRRDSLMAMPSGNVRDELGAILAEVEAAAAGDKPAGTVRSGFHFMDRVTDGFRPGDLIMLGAASGEGKSQLCHNVAWNAAVEQGRNVLIVTIEQHRLQYRRRLLCRHSNKPGVGRVLGIPYNSIKSGRFSDEAERELFARVAADFCGNAAYGILDVTQAPHGMTVEDLRDLCVSFQDRYGRPLHVVAVDYLGLMGTRRGRRDRRDELNDVLRSAKSFATSFDNGRGLVVMAPHQIPRDAREKVKAEEGKFYTMRDFADTSEAEKTADVAVMLLRTPELEVQHEVVAAVVKCRDAGVPPSLTHLFERYETSYLGNLAVG